MTKEHKRTFIIARNRSRRFWRKMRALSSARSEKRDAERIERTRKIEEVRIAAQASRIMRQHEEEYIRAYGTRATGRSMTSLDSFEKKRRYLDAKWQRKWILRKRKMDHLCHQNAIRE